MKQRTRIFIYILVAIAVVILGSLAIINNHQADMPASAQEHIDFGRIYLADLSWEKAVLEFTEAIEIEPLNADAYLGLAKAYVGLEDIPKAIEILEEGYDKTGDERLKDMLEELQPPVPAETTVVTTTSTTITTVEETTTVSTAAMVTVPDLSGLTEEEAIAACESAGLQYSISYDYSDDVEKGYVLGQLIPVNASVTEGLSVPFVVSEGTKIITTVTTIPIPFETTIFTTTQSKSITVEATTSEDNKNDIFVCQYQPYKKFMNGTLIGKDSTLIFDYNTGEYDLEESELHEFIPPINGYYNFKCEFSGNCGNYDCGKDNHSHCAMLSYILCDDLKSNKQVIKKSASTEYLEAGKKYLFYIDVYWISHWTELNSKNVNLKYDIEVYEPEEFIINGDVKGQTFFKDQEQVFYYTPKETDTYNFKITGQHGVYLSIYPLTDCIEEYKGKRSIGAIHGNTGKNFERKVKLEKDVTYKIICGQDYFRSDPVADYTITIDKYNNRRK